MGLELKLRLVVSVLARGPLSDDVSVFCARIAHCDGWGPVVRGEHAVPNPKMLAGGRMNGVSSDRVRGLAQTTVDPALGREIDIAAERCFAPVRVVVSGRTGVGKSSVRAALSVRGDNDTGVVGPDLILTEAASIDVPRAPDPDLDGDVVVHVLAGGLHQADIDAIASADRRDDTTVVVILTKADSIEDPGGVAELMSERLGTRVLPLMSTIATNVAHGRPPSFDSLRPVAHAVTADMLLTPERFLAADIAISRRERSELLEYIEPFGVAIVAAALKDNPAADDAILRALLARTSGIDDAARAVGSAVDGIRVDRQGRLLRRLAELSAHDPAGNAAIEQYLTTDEAVVAVMRAALRACGEPEVDSPTYLAAQQWHDRFRSARDPGQARAALAIARGYTRIAAR